MPHLKAASRQIFTVLDFCALALASVMEVSVFSQDANLQGKMQHSTYWVNYCNTNTESKVHLDFLTHFQANSLFTNISAINHDNCEDTIFC